MRATADVWSFGARGTTSLFGLAFFGATGGGVAFFATPRPALLGGVTFFSIVVDVHAGVAGFAAATWAHDLDALGVLDFASVRPPRHGGKLLVGRGTGVDSETGVRVERDCSCEIQSRRRTNDFAL